MIITPQRSGRHIVLKVSTNLLQFLWHQLLNNYLADLFQTGTDDQAGCVDDRKENIFSWEYFELELRPFVNFSNTILWHQLLIYYLADFFQTCKDDQAWCIDGVARKICFPRLLLPELCPCVNFSHTILWHQLHIFIWLNSFKRAHMIRHDV
jgi:hypothetical protein